MYSFTRAGRVITSDTPHTWAGLYKREGHVISVWELYDEETCRFVDRSKEIPTTTRRVSVMPPLFTPHNPNLDIKNTLHDMKALMGEMTKEEKVRDEVYEMIGTILELCPTWIREMHQMYLQKNIPEIPWDNPAISIPFGIDT